MTFLRKHLEWRRLFHGILLFAGWTGLVLFVGAADSGDWQALFDGKTTTGWHSMGKPTFPNKGWSIEEGCLHLLPQKGGGGDIITARQYTNFEFSCEWRVSRDCNSGIKYLIQEKDGAVGPEYQILDDVNNAEAKHGTTHSTATLYDVLGTTNAHVKPLGEFNDTRIRVEGTHVEHWLNGVKVVSYDLGSPELLAAIAKSKFNTTPFYGRKRAGHILLQDHGHEVWFKNLKIRELP
jgi:hypothetical protein